MFDQFFLSFHPARMPPCPTKGGLSVRFATLDQNFFENVKTHNRHIYRMVLCIAGDIARGGKAPSSFSASSQGQRSRQRVPSPSDPASEKVVCERDVQAHQSQVEPGCDAEGGASHVDDIARCGRWRMATAGGVVAKLMRPSIQRICWLDGIGRGRAPHTAHVAYGSNSTFEPAPITSDFPP